MSTNKEIDFLRLLILSRFKQIRETLLESKNRQALVFWTLIQMYIHGDFLMPNEANRASLDCFQLIASQS